MSRELNEGFSFSALETTGRFVNFQGPGNVVLEGRVYHEIRDVINHEGQPSHWYIYDAMARARAPGYNPPPEETVDLIRQYLERENPYVRFFRSAAEQVPDDTTPFAVELTVPPTGGDVAAIIHRDGLRHVDPRRVVIFGRTDPRPQQVPVLSPYYEPLQYPLLFPHGTTGWGHRDNGQRNRPCTQLQWYRSLFLTEPRFRILGRLAGEYAVDMFSRTEDERLEYLRRGRRMQAAGMDEVADPTVTNFFHYKIPGSFMGSRAWCSDQVADALAIARQLGKPSFWLTMTTNPLWPEIQSQLLPGQTVFDIPAIVNRAFHGRLEKLKVFLRQNFGGLAYEIGVIEFQKRGLPHAHIVIKFKTEPSISVLDSFISAELPDPNVDLALYNQVRRLHIHSRDHLTRPGSRCNRDGRCQYNYPQPITPTTYVDDLGRVHYRRRKPEDAWVTPHMPALLRLLDCHIYVDVCATSMIFLYLYKYLFKGPDHARFTVHSLQQDGDGDLPRDEYQDFVNGRYLSSSESIYRFFGFNCVWKNPSVVCLPVHLEGRNLGQMRRPGPGRSDMSDLLWYFRRPATGEFAGIKYMDFFRRYYLITEDMDKRLTARQTLLAHIDTERGRRQKVLVERVPGNFVVTRIQTVPVREKELFYLRALLKDRPASSFQDLRTIDGVPLQTYQEAAIAQGLFQDLRESEYALTEAIADFSSPSELRFLFANLLLDLPSPPMELWTRFQEDLCADYLRHHNQNDATNRALLDIGRHLSNRGSSLSVHGLPEPERGRHNNDVNQELDFFHPHRDALRAAADTAYGSMNPDQGMAFDTILERLEDPNGGLFFVDGRAGRGKTFLMAAICDRIRGDGGIVCVVGTTALSVIHYERGRTAHSAFGIPVQQSDEGLQSRIKPGSAHAEVLRQANLVIWEEMPMASKVVWECVDELLRNVMSNDLPFGGKAFVGLGDFRQVAPVIRDGSGPAATYANSIRSSDLWERFQILRLTAPMRYAADPAYADWVDRVGDGLPPYETTVDLGHLAHVDDLHAAANYLFMDDNLATSPDAVHRAFLSPFNERVDRFNDLMLDKVDGDHSMIDFSL